MAVGLTMKMKSKPLDQVRSDVPLDAVTKEERVRVNLNVPESMRYAWKLAALNEKRDLSALIIDAMNSYLSTHASR